MKRSSILLVACLALSSALRAAPQFGSDSCGTPDVVPLGSPFGQSITFDNTGATTGTQGQGWSMCDFFPTTVIENDVWFLWTAPATGSAEVVTCTSLPGSVNSRFAVYPGTTCPGSIPIECTQYAGCDSDLGGWVSFEVEQDSLWLIQVGNAPGHAPGIGSIKLNVKASIDHLYRYETGNFAGGGNGYGPNASGEYVWMNRFNAQLGADSLVQIEVAFGSPFSQPVAMVDGTPARVAVWSDPDQDGNPQDAVLLASVATTVQNANTGVAVTVFLPEPVPVQGKFFVGAAVPVTAGQTPASGLASTADGWNHSHQAWVGFSASGPIDLNCLGCLNPPPSHLFGVNGNLTVRARGGADSNTYCFGDGSGATCPCGNTGAANEGCANSSGAGALLWSTGSTKVSTDDLALRATQLPPAGGIGLAIAGSQQQAGGAGVTFQDGLLCVGGTLWRYPAQAFTDSIVQESVVSASNGLISAGSTWNFQVWYRDVVGACGGSTGNLSNALQVAFTP
jgi:hypothetical protein